LSRHVILISARPTIKAEFETYHASAHPETWHSVRRWLTLTTWAGAIVPLLPVKSYTRRTMQSIVRRWRTSRACKWILLFQWQYVTVLSLFSMHIRLSWSSIPEHISKQTGAVWILLVCYAHHGSYAWAWARHLESGLHPSLMYFGLDRQYAYLYCKRQQRWWLLLQEIPHAVICSLGKAFILLTVSIASILCPKLLFCLGTLKSLWLTVGPDNCRETHGIFLIWVDWVMWFMVKPDNCRETAVVYFPFGWIEWCNLWWKQIIVEKLRWYFSFG
jgi:hypothetical protein